MLAFESFVVLLMAQITLLEHEDWWTLLVAESYEISNHSSRLDSTKLFQHDDHDDDDDQMIRDDPMIGQSQQYHSPHDDTAELFVVPYQYDFVLKTFVSDSFTTQSILSSSLSPFFYNLKVEIQWTVTQLLKQENHAFSFALFNDHKTRRKKKWKVPLVMTISKDQSMIDCRTSMKITSDDLHSFFSLSLFRSLTLRVSLVPMSDASYLDIINDNFI